MSDESNPDFDLNDDVADQDIHHLIFSRNHMNNHRQQVLQQEYQLYLSEPQPQLPQTQYSQSDDNHPDPTSLPQTESFDSILNGTILSPTEIPLASQIASASDDVQVPEMAQQQTTQQSSPRPGPGPWPINQLMNRLVSGFRQLRLNKSSQSQFSSNVPDESQQYSSGPEVLTSEPDSNRISQILYAQPGPETLGRQLQESSLQQETDHQIDHDEPESLTRILSERNLTRNDIIARNLTANRIPTISHSQNQQQQNSERQRSQPIRQVALGVPLHLQQYGSQEVRNSVESFLAQNSTNWQTPTENSSQVITDNTITDHINLDSFNNFRANRDWNLFPQVYDEETIQQVRGNPVDYINRVHFAVDTGTATPEEQIVVDHGISQGIPVLIVGDEDEDILHSDHSQSRVEQTQYQSQTRRQSQSTQQSQTRRERYLQNRLPQIRQQPQSSNVNNRQSRTVSSRSQYHEISQNQANIMQLQREIDILQAYRNNMQTQLNQVMSVQLDNLQSSIQAVRSGMFGSNSNSNSDTQRQQNNNGNHDTNGNRRESGSSYSQEWESQEASTTLNQLRDMRRSIEQLLQIDENLRAYQSQRQSLRNTNADTINNNIQRNQMNNFQTNYSYSSSNLNRLHGNTITYSRRQNLLATNPTVLGSREERRQIVHEMRLRQMCENHNRRLNSLESVVRQFDNIQRQWLDTLVQNAQQQSNSQYWRYTGSLLDYLPSRIIQFDQNRRFLIIQLNDNNSDSNLNIATNSNRMNQGISLNRRLGTIVIDLDESDFHLSSQIHQQRLNQQADTLQRFDINQWIQFQQFLQQQVRQNQTQQDSDSSLQQFQTTPQTQQIQSDHQRNLQQLQPSQFQTRQQLWNGSVTPRLYNINIQSRAQADCRDLMQTSSCKLIFCSGVLIVLGVCSIVSTGMNHWQGSDNASGPSEANMNDINNYSRQLLYDDKNITLSLRGIISHCCNNSSPTESDSQPRWNIDFNQLLNLTSDRFYSVSNSPWISNSNTTTTIDDVGCVGPQCDEDSVLNTIITSPTPTPTNMLYHTNVHNNISDNDFAIDYTMNLNYSVIISDNLDHNDNIRTVTKLDSDDIGNDKSNFENMTANTVTKYTKSIMI